jgi:predicted ATPase
MIQCISVSNFRSIKDATIDLPDHFGAILGPNGAGKSNLIHALAYLKGLATGRNADEVAKEISFFIDELFNQSILVKDFEISCCLKINESVYKLEVRVALRNGTAPKNLEIVYETLQKKNENGEFDLIYKREQSSLKGKNNIDLPMTVDSKTMMLSLYKDKEEEVPAIKNFFVRLQICDFNDLDIRIPVGRISDSSDDESLANLLVSLKHNNPEMYKRFLILCKKFLPSVLGLGEVHSAKENSLPENERSYLVLLEEATLNTKLSLQSLSRGDLLTMYLIAMCMTIPENSTLIIEEIENSMHTARISELIKMLDGLTKKRDLQLIFTTHSAQIINMLALNSIIFVDKDRVKGSHYSLLGTSDKAAKITKYIEKGGSLKEYLDSI